jgi:hypothetical protein
MAIISNSLVNQNLVITGRAITRHENASKSSMRGVTVTGHINRN